MDNDAVYIHEKFSIEATEKMEILMKVMLGEIRFARLLSFDGGETKNAQKMVEAGLK